MPETRGPGRPKGTHRKPSMATATIKAPAEVIAAVDAIAAEEGLTRAAVVRRALLRDLRREANREST